MRFSRLSRTTLIGLCCAAGTLRAAPDDPAQPPAPAPTPATAAAVDPDAVYDLGKSLFDQFAPAAVKAEYEFPSREQWDAFGQRLAGALAADSLDDLANYAPEAQAAGNQLGSLPVNDETRGWWEQRLDEVGGAREAVQLRPSPPGPALPSPATKKFNLPFFTVWEKRVSQRPLPPTAGSLMPKLRAAFAAEGLPPELAWIAEAESSLNPNARSPAGAKGLFQLTPDTAHDLGLSTFLPDQRANPESSAHAAAKYLRTLHRQFGEWPLAFAAYNAGAGRVQRALAHSGGAGFAAAASSLPAETRMYVPKVCALIAHRTGLAPEKIPPPRF